MFRCKVSAKENSLRKMRLFRSFPVQNRHKLTLSILVINYRHISIALMTLYYVYSHHHDARTLVIAIVWNYDTQPYVPYTVPHYICEYKENQMYKAQYAFNMSMIMCPAVHMATRSLLRSSSTHEPSDPLSRVKIHYYHFSTITTPFF